MKKCKTLFLTVFILLCFSIIVYGQNQKASFKIGGGIGAPFGDWSEDYNIGFGGNFSIMYPVGPQIDLIGGLEYLRFSGESAEYEYDDREWVAEFSYSRIIIFFGGRYNFKGKTAFYMEGGLGICPDSWEIEGEREVGDRTDTFSISDSKTNFGIRLGGGIIFNKIELMGMFHLIEDSNMFTLFISYRF